ncbi:MAG: hypothetical protein JJT93_01785 [Gammaproteobacteria bacterium]|nr:hypothetical protein [Gammaproteobacteria bacterium]
MNDNTHTNAATPEMSGGSAQVMDRLAKTAHKGIDAASAAVHPTIDRATAGAHKAVDNADQMATHAAEAIDQAGLKGDELISAGTSYMREHPLLTVGLAVTAGYLLSRLLAAPR